MLFNDKLISFDEIKFAYGRPLLLRNGLLQRGDMLLDTQGHANITLAFFDAESNKMIPEFKNVTIHCELGEGILYINDSW